MQFSSLLSTGHLVKRYKRFFADILLSSGEIVTAHCPNTGAMLGLLKEGRLVAFSSQSNPKRKLAYTLEMIDDGGEMVGVNTHTPNKLVFEALQSGFFSKEFSFDTIHREVKINAESRLDFALTCSNAPTCYIEVKNVHYKKGSTAYFPDSVTTRGQKHLAELISLKEQGYRCVMLYVIQRSDVNAFDFADFIDPTYGQMARKAIRAGVEIVPISCHVNLTEITLKNLLPLAGM